jgi:hypothetical protein
MTKFIPSSSATLIAAGMRAMLTHETPGMSFSLADLANMETDEIRALESRLFPAGKFTVRGVSAQIGEIEAKEGLDENGEPYLPLYFAEFKYIVLEADPLDKTVDPASIENRVITNRKVFWPKSFNDEIGLLKGDYIKIGLEPVGRLGGLEGGEPGWLDTIVDHVFELKVAHSKANPETGAQRVMINFLRTQREEG